MSQEIEALLARVGDPTLRADLRRQFDHLRIKRSFGLIFENHLPERVRLPSHPVRRGSRVIRLDDSSEHTWTVESVSVGNATLIREDEDSCVAPLDDLVVVAEFGEPIYPGLRHLGSVQRGGDKPAHVVINGENHHVLEALRFTHAGKVDCIYIDPPYNTGARDWKYDNDYVDADDHYRHSKWLAFMERRLKLARELLDPDNSVLIVTIDEKEYLRLGLLLEQTYSDGRITMVTSSINNAGVTRTGTFGRAAEYIFVVQFGESEVSPLVLPSEEWNPVHTKNKSKIRWNLLLRSGTNTARSVSKIRFYPLFVRDTPAGPVLHSVGEPHTGTDYRSVPSPDGTVAVWPIRQDGSEGVWQISRETLLALADEGFVQLGKWRGEQTTVYYLKAGEAAKVRDGVVEVTGRRSDGSVITDSSAYTPAFVPTDVWRITAHDAGNSGSRLLSSMLPGRRFPFPKSLYAVEDVLRFFVSQKPHAVVLDFFAGSGTTAHAVARLNRQDGGWRQSILVTNNEVSPAEAKALTEAGHRDGDREWEALGIFEHITRPRVTAAITGLTPGGDPIEGDYKFTDQFPMANGFDENVEFFELTYQDGERVELALAFQAIAPLLWLRAGASGQMVTDDHDKASERLPYAVADTYGVLFDPDRWREFLAELGEGARVVFIVTDSSTTFAAVSAELPAGVEAVRLYRNYLSTFEINRADGS